MKLVPSNVKIMKYNFLFLFTFLIANIGFSQSNKTYTVQLGNTMYSIAKQFNVSVDALSKANNNLKAEDLKLGQELIIPTEKKADKKIEHKTPSKNEHVVQAKETLYSISKQHNISVDDLKKWNSLSDNNITIGDTLIIGSKKTISNKKADVILSDEPSKKQLEVITTDSAIVVPKHPLFDNYQQQTTDKEIDKEEVTIAMMTTTNPAMKYAYYALHRTAPVGTILKITNLANGKVSYAKVLGILPDIDENKNIAARISLGVVNQLKTGSGKAYVKIEYAKQ